MGFQQTVIDTIGEELFEKLNKEAEKEVALSIQMPLHNEHGQDNYYTPRFLVPSLLKECEIFERAGLKISPIDITNVLFRSKLLFAVGSETEYRTRVGAISQVDEYSFAIPRAKRNNGVQSIISEYMENLGSYQYERTLLVELNSFHGSNSDIKIVLEWILTELSYHHFVLHENVQHNENSLFIGCKLSGSEQYTFPLGNAQLRTFLALLKIGGFINPGQIDFGWGGVDIMASKIPIFLNSGSTGCYSREEDKKEPWNKLADGSMRRSFGYRGLSKMRLDERNKTSILSFLNRYKNMMKVYENPWSLDCINSIAPILDILVSAIQTFDLGAKLLLINCCLEHLFVPQKDNSNQKKYITGAINALNPDLNDRFDRLYKLRCDYAHKGFVIRDQQSLSLVIESFTNIMDLLNAKLASKQLFNQ